MNKHWSYFIFLTWLAYVMIAGLLLFTGGFLLNRVARPEVSECTNRLEPCSDQEAERCDKDTAYRELFRYPESAAKTCLGKQAKVILLIVDALQYEFAAWHNDVSPQQASYHENKLPIIRDILRKYPESSRFYKFLADPPTTTMQRLKGLTTGSLPTFIDAGTNFATEEINEDNLIDQTARRGIVFMGDDTWIGLYPNRFTRHYSYPSFNVWDLDTVDTGVKRHIFSELQKTDWSLLIAHILGIDHCGHRYGPNHPEMKRKLIEVNELIDRLIREMGDDTMLFVVGDHGMTSTGDHGGESKAEVEAAMFVYSKMPLLGIEIHPDVTEVNQTDLVPTLASILGIPIPFSSLGMTILNVLPSPGQRYSNNLADYQYALHSMWRNVVQTKIYIDTYASDSSLFPEDKLKDIRTKYDVLFERINSVNDLESFRQFVADAKVYLRLIREMCVEIWVQFDSDLMSRGLVLMFCTLFLAYVIVDGIPRRYLIEIFDSSFLGISMVSNLGTAIVIGLLYLFDVIQEMRNSLFFATGMISILMFAILVVQNWEVISMNWYTASRIQRWLSYSSRIIFLLSICGLLSNSYIIEEGLVLSFLLITLVWLLVFNTENIVTKHFEKKSKFWPKTHYPSSRLLLILFGLIATMATRLSNYFWTCREEQSRSCDVVELRKPGAIIFEHSGRTVVVTTLIIIALFVTLVRIWLRSCGNLTGFAPAIIVTRYCPSIIVVCMGGYWVLQRLPKAAKIKFIGPWQVNVLTWIVYGLTAIGISVIFIRPLCIFLLPKKREFLNVHGRDNIIPQLFNGIKGLIYRKKETDDDSPPVVYGLGTVYSASFITISVFLTLLCALLLGDTLAPSIVIMYLVCISVLGIMAIERYQHAANISELFDFPTSSILCWVFISEYFLYGTGHQPTFTKIHWDAAFVGTGGHFPTNIVPAMLIGINTFGPHMLLGFTLPLTVISPFALYLMFPKLAGSTFPAEKDLKKGELILYDEETNLFSSVFVVSAKYMIFHGIRTFGCMLATTIHCRHLMVWNVFSPKLIFESLAFFVTTGSVVISYLLLIRVHGQINRLIMQLSKIR